jgi:nitrate/TMAO reductase-like tetraheme cytochrome c subunit
MGKSAGCGEGHVPKEFGPKRWRKIRAVSEIDHHLKGTIDHDLPAGIDVDELIEDIDF